MNMAAAPICGVVLAGGLASRLGGGDKTLLEIGGKTILGRVLERMAPHCAEIILNANGEASRFTAFGLPVVADTVPDFAGPLAGVLAGMDWAATNMPQAEWLATAPGDCPFLPRDLLPQLFDVARKETKPIACAKSGEWRHPLAALFRISLRDDLRRALTDDGMRKVEMWTERHGVAYALWPDQPVDLFLNVNSPEDLREAERIAAEYPEL